MTHLASLAERKHSRPKLDLVLGLLQSGDTLKITRLDRPSRSVQHLINLGADLRNQESACT